MRNDLEGKNTFCGPYCLAYLSGKTTDETARAIRKVSGRSQIKTTYASEVGPAMIELGIRMLSCKREFSHNLNTWVREHMRPSGLYMLLITGHYIVIDAGQVFETGHLRTLETLGRRRVKFFWEIKR